VDARDQVMFVLQVVTALGPVAIYFLGLGLVNSQARPFLISARRDFSLLAGAFLPLILVPTATMAQNGHGYLALAVVTGVVLLFAIMLPPRRGVWVVYNVGPDQLLALLQRACRRQGWSMAMEGDLLTIQPPGLQISRHSIHWLRNATLELHGNSRHTPAESELLAALREELSRESMLASPTGASLVVVGASLLGLPMWYLFHHMDLIVEVVRHILFAGGAGVSPAFWA
jgi:hypothetical protein